MKKTPEPRKSTPPVMPEVEFVNYELTKEDVKRLKDEFVPSFEFAAVLTALAEEGLRITIKWDERGNCGSAFLSPISSKSANFGLMLTGRGRTAAGALVEVAFKHYVIFDHQWPRRDDKRSFELWDD